MMAQTTRTKPTPDPRCGEYVLIENNSNNNNNSQNNNNNSNSNNSNNSNDNAPALFTASGSTGLDGENGVSIIKLTEEEQDIAFQYCRLLEVGLEDGFVRQMMVTKTVHPKIIAYVLKEQYESEKIFGRDCVITTNNDQSFNDMNGTPNSEFESTYIHEESGDSLGPLLSPLPVALETDNSDGSDYNMDSDSDDFNMDEANHTDIQRKEKKHQNDLSKRHRMSIFNTASGCQTVLPLQRFTIEQKPPAGKISVSGGVGKDKHIVPSIFLYLGQEEKIVVSIFSYLKEEERLTTGFLVCKQWSDWANIAYVNLILRCTKELEWNTLHTDFPWGRFLSQGGAKKVYQVHNQRVGRYEALSVMDTKEINDLQIIANEVAITAMLSSLARRGICPNFLIMRSVFTCAYSPPTNRWGNRKNQCPKTFVPNKPSRAPALPTTGEPGRYQYIRMEWVNKGDAEEFIINQQRHGIIEFDIARALFFQIAFALYVAADKFSLKHYDLKLLNIFVQHLCDNGSDIVFRYGLGAHVFALRMCPAQAFVAKLADYGTASTDPSTNGQPVGIAHYTTLENTPPDFLILGNHAKQGHEHDSFGLGLCMLHLFTGHRPYEEIMEEVHCPPKLKKQLQEVWENDNNEDYSIIRSIIYDGVYTDDHGHIIKGDPDETFYHTLYRFLVLFGIPSVQFQEKSGAKVWSAIDISLQSEASSDVPIYDRDCEKYSILSGSNKYIARARVGLHSFNGMNLLLQLCSFDPNNRPTALEVLNSTFMEDLHEDPSNAGTYEGARVFSYTSFSTNF